MRYTHTYRICAVKKAIHHMELDCGLGLRLDNVLCLAEFLNVNFATRAFLNRLITHLLIGMRSLPP